MQFLDKNLDTLDGVGATLSGTHRRAPTQGAVAHVQNESNRTMLSVDSQLVSASRVQNNGKERGKIPWPLGQGTIQHAHRGPHSNFFPS